MFRRIWIHTSILISIASADDWKPQIPKTWDDAAIAAHEMPLAQPAGTPKHISAEYYYRIPVQPIFKSYPVYAPGHEPSGYVESLKKLEPVIVWDDKGHRPPLQTEADWRRAGEIVFDAPITFSSSQLVEDVRNSAWYESYTYAFRRAAYFPSTGMLFGPRALWKWEASPARTVIRGSCRMEVS